jgi:hypothetical protein
MMQYQSVTGKSVAAWPVIFRPAVARLLAGATLVCIFASANADQLLVTAANSDGDRVYDLMLSPSNTVPPTPVISGTTTPINIGDPTPHGSFDALVWVPNSYCKSLDLIVADAAKGQIVRYSGASTVVSPNCYRANGTATVNNKAQVIFNWITRGSGPAQPNGLSVDANGNWITRGSGPAQPNGLSVDANGNLFVISSSGPKDFSNGPKDSSSGPRDLKPSVWVLPFNQSANLYCNQQAGVYCAPVLIDNTFSRVLTLALAETVVASTTTPLWKAGDLLVLVGDSFAARLTVYSQGLIYGTEGLIATRGLPLSGPSSIAIPRLKFLEVLAAPFGMDLWPADATHGTSVLFTTIDGRILRFDTSKSAFVTNFASGLGLGLQKLKVGTYADAPYAFVAQVGARDTGQILAFAAPPTSGANNKPLAVVRSGVMNPVGLAVSNSGSQPVPTVTAGTPCAPPNPACTFAPLGPELTTTLISYPGDNLTGTVLEQSCTVPSDPRVSTSDGWVCSGADLPIGNSTIYCPAFPAAVIPGSVCGHSGPTGSGFAVVEGTATGIDPNDNNSFLTTVSSIDAVLPGTANLECSTFPTTGQIPLIAWGTRSDLPTIEGTIPEDTAYGTGALTELTSACDTSTTGARGVSIYAFGLGLNLGEGGINSYVDNKYANLLSTVNTANISNAPPSHVQSTIANYITTSQTYFDGGNNSCALYQLVQADSYVRSNANPGNFSSNLMTTGAGGGNPNPAGDIDGRLGNLYLTINTEVAGNPPNTTWPVPAGSVPACAASTIFGNTGAGISIGYNILGQEDPSDNYAGGFLLTPTGSGNLASISAPIGDLSGSSTSVTFHLYTNNSGTPGSLLDTLTATVGAFNPSVASPITAFASTNYPFLSSAQSYWVVASSASEIGWNVSYVLAAPGNRYWTDNGTVINVGGGAEGALILTSGVPPN